MELPPIRFDISTPPDIIQAAIEEYGGAIVENVLSRADLAELHVQIATHLAQTKPDTVNPFNGKETIRFGKLLERVPKTREIVRHPLVVAQMERILRQYGVTYALTFDGVMSLRPGQKTQRIHRDNVPFCNHPRMPIILLAVMWAVDEFRRDNGGTVFAPGSHKWKDGRKPTREELCAVEMPPGSVFFYAGNVYHGSGRCVTERRTGVSFQYSASWMRQEVNPARSVPPEYAAANFDEELLKLMGYDLISRNCGEVDSKHPLDDLLQDGKNRSLDIPGYEYTNGRVRKLFIFAGEVNADEDNCDVTLDD